MASSPKSPSTPSRMISGRAPTRRARTGVPQARDSMLTRPNGSGQGRPEDILVIGPLGRQVADLGRDPERPAGPRRNLDRLDRALLRIDPADEAEGLAAADLEGRAGEIEAVVDDRPGDLGMDA